MIAAARKGEASLSQVARDFAISESCLQRWLEIADWDDGLAPPAAGDGGGGSKDESAELRVLRRRNKLLEQENEILCRAKTYFARDVLPRERAGSAWRETGYVFTTEIGEPCDPRNARFPYRGCRSPPAPRAS